MGKILEPNEETPQNDFIHELPPQQIMSLVKIQKLEDIKTIDNLIYWEDDRTLCVGVLINGIEVCWWWHGPHLIGHLMYSNVVPEAKKEVFDALKELINRSAEQEENVAKTFAIVIVGRGEGPSPFFSKPSISIGRAT